MTSDSTLLRLWPAYDIVPAPCLLLRSDFRILAVNETYLEAFRCEQTRILQQHFFDTIIADTETGELLRNSFAHSFNTRSTHQLSSLSFEVAGAETTTGGTWNIKTIPVGRSGHEPSGIIVFITPAKEAGYLPQPGQPGPGNNRIVNSIKNYAIFSLDTRGIITSWNKGAELIKGYTAEETIGRSMDIFYTEQDMANGVPSKNLALALKNEGLETEGWRLRKDGTAFYANILFTPLIDEKGSHYGFSKVTRDITGERNDREHIHFLADISRNIEDPIISTDTSLNITRWNQAAERLFGWTSAEAIGRTTKDVLQSQFSTRERNDILKSLQTEGYWHGQVTYLTKTGKPLICLCTVSHLKDAKEIITGNLILLKDITQRIEAENALARLNEDLETQVAKRTSQLADTEKKYEELFQNNPMPMWVIRQSDFRFLAVNNMAVMQYGYSREEFLSMTALDIRPDDEKELFINLEREAKTTSGNFNMGVWKHRKKDGKIILVQIMVHDISFENTAAKMVLANDITEKVLAEEKIAASEKQLSNTLNNMLEGIQVHDFNWRYLFVNDALIHFDGSGREELLGKRLMDRYPGIEQTDVFKAMDRVMRNRVPERLETEFEFPDGRKSSFQLSIQPVPEGIFVLSIDITERRKAQEEYRKSQESYFKVMERISDAFVAFDEHWNYVYVNKAASSILNKTAEHLLGKNVWTEFPESVNYNLYKAFHSSLEKQVFIQLEEYYVPFGMWMEFNIYPSPNGVTVFFSDITKRKEAELKLVESEANLKAIFDNTSEGFILTDRKGDIKAFNNRITEIILPSIAGMRIGSNIFDLTEASRLEFFSHLFNQVLSGETVQYDRHFKIGEDQSLWINLGFNPVAEKGEIVGVCITARDITERRWAEEQLQKSYFEKRALAEKLSAILNTLPANIALVDPAGRIIEVNDPWRKFAIDNDYKGEDFGLGLNYLDVARSASGDDKEDGLNVANGLSLLLEEGTREFVYEYPSNSSNADRWFRMIATSLQEKEYAGAVIMHLEISELKRSEAERLQLQMNEQKKITQAILQGQEKERNHIGQELHDNINQILAGTRIYLAIAGNRNEQVKESVRYPLELLDQSIEEIRKLCASMVTPLNDVQLEELVNDLLKKMNSGGIETTFNYSIPVDHLSDALKLNIYRIIQELSSNILKYAQASKVTVALKLEDTAVKLVVTDNGKGFNTAAKKNGIGLSNILSRVQSFSGTMDISSKEGAGTKTNISLPVE